MGARFNTTQKNLMVQFIQEHPEMQNTTFSPNFSWNDARRLWETVSNLLNAVEGGAHKNWKQWRKVNHFCTTYVLSTNILFNHLLIFRPGEI